MNIEVVKKELEDVTKKLKELQEYLEKYDNEALKRKEDLIIRSTLAEKIFKFKLKELNLKYEFQKIIKCNHLYRIVDFYIPEYNLIIEIDGDYHITNDQKIKDKSRTQQLVSLGYNKIIRFDNIKAKNISTKDLLKNIKAAKAIKTNGITKQQKILKYKQRIAQLTELISKFQK